MTASVNYLKIDTLNVKFELDENNILDYVMKKPNFGFNGVGEFTYLRSYSRLRSDGSKESWYDTVLRVVNGTYSIQKRHILSNKLFWDEEKAQQSATRMFRYMFDFKFLPPGRGLWAMGTPIVEDKGLYEALNNCAFVSTANIDKNFTRPFTFMMDASMLGVGVGFDVLGSGKRFIYKPNDESWTFVVPDSREGWVEALRHLLESYEKQDMKTVLFDYSQIRPAGEPLKTFGGFSSGHKHLEDAMEDIRDILNRYDKNALDINAITDIMNIIGRAVVSGGIRRTAQIAFGSTHVGETFSALKNYEKNAYRSGWGWLSNNSIVAELGSDYTKYVDDIVQNGEPGFLFIENAQRFGRMGINAEHGYADPKVVGANPCNEQSLEDFEMCCLVETFPNNCRDLDEYLDVLKYAYLYAKTVTLGNTKWPETNEVMLRNRRIGTSISGIAQFIERRGISTLISYMSYGYRFLQKVDRKYSDWFKIPMSIKTTSIKPSGTVSLLAGSTPGIHYPTYKKYIRRIRVSNNDPLLQYAKDKGYEVEPEVNRMPDGSWVANDHTSVISFYVDVDMQRSQDDLTMWEQLELAALAQEYWADNQVSVTVTFDPETEGKDLDKALDLYQYRLKGVSFLPKRDLSGDYRQLPYEKVDVIPEQKINHDVHLSDYHMSDSEKELFCTTDKCVVE